MWDKLKAWWLAFFLKKYIQPDDRKPQRYPKTRYDIDEPCFIDHYFERTSDPSFAEIDEKVKQAVANLKVKGKL